MKKIDSLKRDDFKEYPAKPALLSRRDITQELLQSTCTVLGINPNPQTLLEIPFPSEADNAEVFRREYWAAEMWSKFPFEMEGVDREAVALTTFRESERSCGEANSRLVEGWSRPWPESIRGALKRARRNICRLVDDITVDEVFARAGWGPGASTSLRRSESSLQTKWEAATHVTERAMPYVYAYKQWCSRDVGQQSRVAVGNRITTVPKNAKTERVIAIEPDWNMFLQKGVGSAIRRRLNKLNLLREDEWHNSQSLNRDLARFGSCTDTFGTIDLRGASDGISLALCELLLPSSLLKLIVDLRSPWGVMPDGSLIPFEKVSSMGNGMTFELETLLFWGLSTAVDEAGAVVYGDDIIVQDREVGLRLIELLEFCGLQTNPKKTFLSGPFRESCGGHYFNGVDVTPPYVRKPVSSLPALISTGNALRRANQLSEDPLFLSEWERVLADVPRVFRGPTSAGDICLHAPFDACTPTYIPRYQCFAGLGIAGRVGRQRAPERGGLLTALHSAAQGASWGTDHHDYYVVSRWLAPQWTDG